jgi:predicted transcriptional regulator of viral defense system
MKNPKDIFRSRGGQLRMRDALEAGISRYTLYSLRDKGEIEQVSRGVYRLVELPALSNPDLVTIALRCPKAVVCLISALHFHEITTQIPHRVSIAIPRKSRPPSIDQPPITVYRFSQQSYEAGIEEHRIDGIQVKIYSVEKTLADCFKFREKIGMDVTLEALKRYRERKDTKIDLLLEYARVCRVEKILFPYLEALV